MAAQITDEHVVSSFAIGTAPNASAEKLNIDWIELDSELKDLASSSNRIPNLIPIEAYRSVPTEAELCLLICSMFPENFKLPIEDLVVYGMALNYFEDVHNMPQARCRVHSLIKIINNQPPSYLIKLCLWEDKYGNQYIKVLDSAKNLAKLIASKYQLACSPETVERKQPNSYWHESCYGLSFVFGFNEYPINLASPKLSLMSLLQLQPREDSQSIPIDVFEGVKELFDLSVDVLMLRNLRTLRLKVVKLEDMSWIGGLTTLELLSISTSSLADIPKEMGQLVNLRLLDLREMNVASIPPGVLSKMLKLEELYLPLHFRKWGCNGKSYKDYDERELWGDDDFDEEVFNESISEMHDGSRINASLGEIVSLSLNAFQVSLLNAALLPKRSLIFKNVQRFKILVPNNLKYNPFGDYSMNVLQLTGDVYDIKDSCIYDLISKTEDLSLIRVRNLKNIIYQIEDYDFPLLKKMIISECADLEYLFDLAKNRIPLEDSSLFWKLESVHLSMLCNLKEIWHGRWADFRWFENLSHISIRFCHKLIYVFPLSIVKGLKLPIKIEVLDCNEMVGIFHHNEEDGNPYSIEELNLHSLPKLVSLLVLKDYPAHVISSSFRDNEIASNSMDKSIDVFDGNFQSLSTNESTSRYKGGCMDFEEFIHPPSISVRRGELQQNNTQQFDSNTKASLFRNEGVISHMKMCNAFPSKQAETLRNLKRLKIAFCDALKVIFFFEKNHVTTRAFNFLEELKLYSLRNLMYIWFLASPKLIAFQNLQLLVLSECDNILYLFPLQVAKVLVKLQKVHINRCKRMEEIIAKENEGEVGDKIVFPQLEVLELGHVPNLKIFSSGIYAIELPSMGSLKLNQCEKMKSFSNGSLRTPMLKRIHINGSIYSLKGDLNATMKRYMDNWVEDPSNIDDLSSTIRNRSPSPGSSNNVYDTTTSTESPTMAWENQFETASNEEANSDGQILEGPDYMKEFTFGDLKCATNNFSSSTLVGEGDFSKVYKGWFDEKTFGPSKTQTGIAVAIKRFYSGRLQRIKEWQLEVKLLERISHPNVVKLLGHCMEDNELFLVYEFMQKGSLENHLFRRNPTLSWDMRLKIAIGVARGLNFLHTSEKKVIHRDIKPSSILLDGNCNAKVSDFGKAKWGPTEEDSDETTRFNGTDDYIYADPEYMLTGKVPRTELGRATVKSDVYSFGVVLLELMTGLRAMDENRGYSEQNLVQWLTPILSQKSYIKYMMDARIEGQYSIKAMLLTAELALKCTNSWSQRKHSWDQSDGRPSMSKVLEALRKIARI